MTEKSLPTNPTDPWEEMADLTEKMGEDKEALPKDVNRFRKLALSMPERWHVFTVTMSSLQQQLIEKLSHNANRAYLLAELDILKKELGQGTAPPLERLLIEQILTARLRLLHVESIHNENVNQSINLKTGEYWQDVLTATQARYLRAIESLARVRRLARNVPALQVNINQPGGKQVNVQGEVKTPEVGN